MIKIAICDDYTIQLHQIEKLINQYFGKLQIDYYEVRSFSSSETLLDYVMKNGSFDIYLLDVIMPKLNGIEIGQKLREIGEDSFIVYLSSEPSYSLEAFSVRAFHYLIKPIQQEKFFNVMDEIYNFLKNRHSKSKLVKTKDGIKKIEFDDIVYIESIRRKMYYHLYHHSTIESTTIHTSFDKATQDLLEDHRFVLCGVSFVLNVCQISSIIDTRINFKNGDYVLIPKKNINHIRHQWLNYYLKDN